MSYPENTYTWLQAFGNGSNSSGSPDATFKIAGSSASTADYPVWVSYTTVSGGLASGTFSFSDSTSGGTQSPTGWDDFQDGSGMGDQWRIEGSGATVGVYRGNPSLVALQ